MVKKMMAIFLILAFTAVSAATPEASVAKSLSAAFDNLNYTLTVEWDQKDTKFYNEALDSFKAEVEKLQAQGLSNEELIEFGKSQIKDKKLAKDLNGLLDTIKINKLSKNEARKFVMENIAKNYSEGASWSGDAFVIGSVIALVVILAILIAAADSGSSSSSSSGHTTTCYDDYVCIDYYDSWGWYLYTDCFWETYCY